MPKILIAEDDRDLRGFLADELTAAGYSVKSVPNGADAVVAAAEETFDIFLLDMLMPGLNGVQVIRVLRKLTPTKPIVGLTGYLGQGYMSEAADYGVTCLSKPVAIDDLLTELAESLKQGVRV
jgi:DNA-binding response OmpR family regulator